MPLDELETRLNEFAPEQEIVAYCRGKYCVLADEAVALLTERGYRARGCSRAFPTGKSPTSRPKQAKQSSLHGTAATHRLLPRPEHAAGLPLYLRVPEPIVRVISRPNARLRLP